VRQSQSNFGRKKYIDRIVTSESTRLGHGLPRSDAVQYRLLSTPHHPGMSDTIYTIQPSRLDWDPEDTRKVSEGGSLLGEGTFGSVYRGKYNHITVAIKVIKNRSDVQSTGRTAAEQQHAREIRRLRELSFKHIVQCYGISKGPKNNDVAIVTECLEGGSLHQSLQQARVVDARLSDLSFLTIASHIAKGLSYVHDSGFIHGDMKPHNVLLTGSINVDAEARIADFPPYVEAKIADFGMSKRLQGGPASNLLESSVEFGSQAFGTFAYMAPEVFSGAMHLDNEELKRVDVYAFGVVLYEMLTGISPWQYEGITNPMHLYNLVCGEHRRPAWGPRSDVIRPEHKRMIEICWHQDNMRRPQIGDLIKQLDTWIVECKKAPRASLGTNSLREPISMKAEHVVRTVAVNNHEVLGDSSDISGRIESISVSDSNSTQEKNMRVHAANQIVKVDSTSGEHFTTDSPSYWEQNSPTKPRPVILSDQKYDPGDSVDIPAVKKSQGSSNSSSEWDAKSRNLQEFSDLAGGPVTRVVTQVIKQPVVPQLDLFGAEQSPGLNNNSWWDAVDRQNKTHQSTKPGPTGGSNVSVAWPTTVCIGRLHLALASSTP
jgi:serine/threonine protein kinase